MGTSPKGSVSYALCLRKQYFLMSSALIILSTDDFFIVVVSCQHMPKGYKFTLAQPFAKSQHLVIIEVMYFISSSLHIKTSSSPSALNFQYIEHICSRLYFFCKSSCCFKSSLYLRFHLNIIILHYQPPLLICICM